MDLSNLRPADGSKHSDISEEVVDTAQEMVRLLVRDTKVRKLVLEPPRPGFEGGQMPFLQTYS